MLSGGNFSKEVEEEETDWDLLKDDEGQQGVCQQMMMPANHQKIMSLTKGVTREAS